MRLVVALVLVASAASAEEVSDDPLALQEQRHQAIYERVAPSVVFLLQGDHLGSGFFVDPDGLVLTNNHVVSDNDKVEVVLFGGRHLAGTVVERGTGKIDVALVRVDLKNAPTLVQGSVSDLRVGSWVASVGHGRGAIWTFNVGMVSNIYPDGTEKPVFQTQIPLNPGNSGGPIVDRRGRVVGIVTAGLADSSAINFGIGMEVARRSLPGLASHCDCLVIEAPAGIPVFVNGKVVGSGPKIVVPATAQTYDVFAVIDGRMRRVSATFPKDRLVTLAGEAKADGPPKKP